MRGWLRMSRRVALSCRHPEPTASVPPVPVFRSRSRRNGMTVKAPHQTPAEARQIRTASDSESPKESWPVYRIRLRTRTSAPDV